LTPNQIAAVEALDLRGIYLMASTRRWYPNGKLGAHLIGYVGVDQGEDNKGLAGVEHKFDSLIRGREGRLQVQYDANRKRMATRVEQAPTAGATVELTIDLTIQYIVERELQEAVRANQARGGTVVVTNPWTGEILAMASWPRFNPNAPAREPEDHLRNRAVQEVYEPGSTFKIVTASAAIEERVLRMSDLIDCSPGYITFGSRVIRDDHPLKLASFEDVIVHSSNVGAVKAGQQIGAERLGRYINRFGFGERLTVDFGGESRGRVFDPAALNASALASVSMGYQISVTPLQMVTAMGAIANGGQLVEPHLVRATIQDDVRTAREPKVLRRAIEAETAVLLTGVLEEVVRRGTARSAALDRYQVAGKTGTAKKVVNGQYVKEYNASFVGFVPSRRPALAIVVVIDSPRGDEYYGGRVAAPVFRRIAEAALRQLGVPPTINPVPPAVVPPATLSPDVEAAGGPAVLLARPAAVAPALVPVKSDGSMPDVRGLSGRAAVQALARAGVSIRMMNGDGFVIDQQPLPGVPITAGSSAVLRLSRK
jgi:cell division protein FtsI/penicillin-binding protein 2